MYGLKPDPARFVFSFHLTGSATTFLYVVNIVLLFCYAGQTDVTVHARVRAMGYPLHVFNRSYGNNLHCTVARRRVEVGLEYA